MASLFDHTASDVAIRMISYLTMYVSILRSFIWSEIELFFKVTGKKSENISQLTEHSSGASYW